MWGQVTISIVTPATFGIIPMRVGTRCHNSIGFIFYQDHPHACGDKAICNISLRLASGSSPCVWGQVAIEPLSIIRHRIIPMRVGTRRTTQNRWRKHWDHPHACGDKCSEQSAQQATLGSSPCVWGQVNNVPLEYEYTGIIPMRVGTRLRRYRRLCLSEDHPHACGDKAFCKCSRSFAVGSSPCVWGQESGELESRVEGGIIPMRVGTRNSP